MPEKIKPAPRVLAKPVAKPSRGTPPVVATLPSALEGLSIKDYFIPSTGKRAGTIKAMLGHVVVVHRATNEAYFARPGDIIYENDAIYTLDKSICRINFFDDDLVSMAANTEFAVDQYEDKRQEKKKISFFTMLKGKAMFYALRLFRYKQMAFRVKAPTAVVGVRGTKFGVHVRWMEEKTASRNHELVASSDAHQAFVVASAGGGGGQYCTEAFCADGLVSVDGKEVPAGYKYDCETGQVTPYSPEYLRKFEEETGVGTGKKAKAGEEEEGFEPPFGPAQGQLANGADEQSDNSSEQNVPRVGSVHVGYFSALLTNTTGNISFHDIYVSSGVQNFEIVTPGSAGLTDSGDLGTSYPLSVTVVGSNAYMEWGYWTMQSPWTSGGESYIVISPAWYVYGLPTLDTVVQGLRGTVNYSGEAYGTYHPAWASAVSMSGSFNCQVDFTSGNVSNFNLTVSGGDYSASISNANGSLNGG